MKISVIVPLYKGGKYINGILSMLEKNAYTLKEVGASCEIELVIVNDYEGEEIKKEGPIIINNRKNMGIHKSRIIGLRSSTGDYIHFLDQDDKIAANFYARQLEKIKDKDAVVCNGINNGDCTIYSSKVIATYYNGMPKRIISPGQVLVRRESIPKTWMNIVLNNNGYDDLFLWYLMILNNNEFVINDEQLFEHVINGNNSSWNMQQMRLSLEELSVIMERFNNYNGINLVREDINKRLYTASQNERLLTLIESVKKEDILNKKIAIYGMGRFGKLLIKRFREIGIDGLYIIDRDIENRKKDELQGFKGVSSIKDINNIEDIDTIVVTTNTYFEEVKSQIGKTVKKVMTLNQFLEEDC